MNDPTDIQNMTDEQAFAAALANDDAEGQPAAGEAPATAAAGDGGGAEPGAPASGGDPAQDHPAGGVDTPQNPAQPAPEDDIFASLPDSARPYVESLRNRAAELESAVQATKQELARARNDHAAMAGKLRPLQQRLSELEKAQRQQPAPAQPAQAQPETVEDLDAFLQTPEWKQYAETFPNEAAVWEKGQRASVAVAAKLARSEAQRAVREIEGRFAPTINRIETESAKRAHEAAIADLASEHPDWQQINADPRFSEWFDGEYLPAQLDVVQQAFADDNYARRQLSNPGFVKRLLHEYKARIGSQSTPTAKAAQPQARQQAPARLAVAAAPAIPPAAPRTRAAIETMTDGQAFRAALNSDD